MTGKSLQVWNALINCKSRRRGQLERAIDEVRQEVSCAHAALREREHMRDSARKRLRAQEERLTELIEAPILGPLDYLNHDALRRELDDSAIKAEEAVAVAQARVDDRENVLRNRQQDLVRLDAMLDHCREVAQRIGREQEMLQELASEEETFEALFARAGARVVR